MTKYDKVLQKLTKYDLAGDGLGQELSRRSVHHRPRRRAGHCQRDEEEGGISIYIKSLFYHFGTYIYISQVEVMKTLLTPSHSIGPSVEGSMCGFSPGGTYSSHVLMKEDCMDHLLDLTYIPALFNI